MPKEQMKYLVYDIETCIHKKLLNKVCYAHDGLTDEEAHKKELAELAKDNREFINPSFHQPVCLAAVAVAADFSITKIGLLGGDDRTTPNVVKSFWNIYNDHHPILVDFNGKGFDIRVLELWAFKLGLTINPRHFSKFGPRYRFAEDVHIDLSDFLSNFGAIRYKGGLNLFSKILGKPGKMDTHGSMVQELFEAGDLNRIEDYCLCDAMDTYFVFLRTRVMTGELSLKQEAYLVDKARHLLEIKNQEEGWFKEYLDNFGDWDPNF